MTRFVKRHSNGRMQATGAGGRFIRNTLENFAGLRVLICPICQSFNTYGLLDNAPEQSGPFIDPLQTWKPPTNCHNCGAPLKEKNTTGGEG